MKNLKTLAVSLTTVFFAGAVLALLVAWPLMGTAQVKSNKIEAPDPHAQHKAKLPAGDQGPGGQKQGMKIQGMGDQQQDSSWWFENYTRGQKPYMGDKIMADRQGGMGGMTGRTNDKMEAGSMAGDSPASGMGMISDVDLMGMMGTMDDDLGMMGLVAIAGAGSKSMKGMEEMKTASSLPGSPGVSHIYHIGATEFFLNHAEHLNLTIKQLATLNVVKRKALLHKLTAQRKIAEAEQELWELTGSDEPDAPPIQAKVQTIEILRGEQRMAFIQSVGEATQVLTDEQRQMLLGTMQPDATAGK